MVKISQRTGLWIGIACNALILLKALPYAFLPVGSAVPMDTVLYDRFITGCLYAISLLVALLFGFPLAIRDYHLNGGKPGNKRITYLAVALCIAPLFMPTLIQQQIYDKRQLRTPCIICDGGQTSTKGYYFFPPDERYKYSISPGYADKEFD